MNAIITWDNAQQKANGMAALATRVGSVHSVAWAEDVADVGDASIKTTITIGGMIPTKKGGPRIDSGEMIDSMFSHGFGGAGGKATARAGWSNAAPLQTIFQEGGTRDWLGRKRIGGGQDGKKGIAPMLSIPEAEKAMSKSLVPTGKKMQARIKAEWDSI